MLSSNGKNFECFVREQYLKKISVVGVYLKHLLKLDGLALGIFYSFRFDLFSFVNRYGRLIRRKGLIPFVSISLLFCRSNWLTKVDLRNRKTAFQKLSTFSAASVRALVRPRTSSYRFFALSSLSAFASWSNLARCFFLASCNVGTQSTLCLCQKGASFPETKSLRHTRSLLSTSFGSVSPQLIAFIYFSLRSVVSSSSTCWMPLKVFDKIQSVYPGHFYFHSTKLRNEMRDENDLIFMRMNDQVTYI